MRRRRRRRRRPHARSRVVRSVPACLPALLLFLLFRLLDRSRPDFMNCKRIVVVDHSSRAQALGPFSRFCPRRVTDSLVLTSHGVNPACTAHCSFRTLEACFRQGLLSKGGHRKAQNLFLRYLLLITFAIAGFCARLLKKNDGISNSKVFLSLSGLMAYEGSNVMKLHGGPTKVIFKK